MWYVGDRPAGWMKSWIGLLMIVTNVSTTCVVSFLASSRDGLYRAGCRNVSRGQRITITECTCQDEHITTASSTAARDVRLFPSTPSRTFRLSPFPALKLIPEKPMEEAAASSYVRKITTIIIWITVYRMMPRTKGWVFSKCLQCLPLCLFYPLQRRHHLYCSTPKICTW